MKVLAGWDEDGVAGCSVTGGYVYRGELVPEIYGHYFFSDYCSGKIWSFKLSAQNAIDFQDHTEELLDSINKKSFYLSSFGETKNGELLLVDYNGSIYTLSSE